MLVKFLRLIGGTTDNTKKMESLYGLKYINTYINDCQTKWNAVRDISIEPRNFLIFKLFEQKIRTILIIVV